MADQCSAYKPGICRNGFPTNAACIGVKCHDCGRPTDKAPACMDEDISPRWLDDAGKPRYVIAAEAPNGEKRDA